MDPLFWLALSLLLVAISLTAVLVVMVPAIQEVGRAARSVEKLFDTLYRDLPPTLEAIRLTGLEISELTDDVTDSVKSAGKAAKQVEESIVDMRQQAQNARGTTRSVMVGMKAAWQSLTRPTPPSDRRRPRLASRSPSASNAGFVPEESPGVPLEEKLGTPLHLPPRSSSSHPSSSQAEPAPVEIPEEIYDEPPLT